MNRWALLSTALVGVVVGLFTALQATRVFGLGALHVSVGAIAAFVLNAGFGTMAAWALRSRDAAFVPGAGWFGAVLGVIFLPHPGGDIVLPGAGGDAIAFLLLGILGVIVAGAVATRVVQALPRSDSDR